MSKASVAQEPSMDEILASIRRIIETGDEKTVGASREAAVGAARQIPAFLAGATVRDLAEPPAASAGLVSYPSIVADAEPAPASRYPGESAHAAQPLFPAFGDDDQLTAELETELAATWERIEVGRDRDGAAAEDAHSADAGYPAARSQPMSSDPETHADLRPHDFHPSHEDTGQATHPPAATVPQSESHEAPMERNAFEPANTDARLLQEPAVAASRYGDTPPPIVSPATGQLVGASFNELAEAIRHGELRSLEAMAQEMLQPMLRDWLDDNLPQMVERLIREEIERLARGGAKR